MARNVAVHEVRHVIDMEQGVTCAGCPEGLRESVVRELSAYLATLSSGPAPVTELFLMCHSLQGRTTYQHGTAKRLIVARLMHGDCMSPIPDDLPAQAKALEEELLSRSSDIALPDTFPDQLASRHY